MAQGTTGIDTSGAGGTARPPGSPPPVAVQPNEYQKYVDRQLQRTRRRVWSVDLTGALLIVVIWCLVCLAVMVLADHWLVEGGLGFRGRLVAMIVWAVGTAVVAGRVLLPLVVRRINPLYAAATIERSQPGLKNSLINLLQLRGRPDQLGPVIYQAIEQRAAQDLSAVSIDSTVDRSWLVKLGYVLLAVVAMGTAYKLFSPKDPLRSVERVLAPWADISAPTRVQIDEIEPRTTEAYFDDRLKVSARVMGLKGSEPVTLYYSTRDKQIVDAQVRLTAEQGFRFGVDLPDAGPGLQQDIDYYLKAGDATTPTYHVRVVTVPSIVVDRVEYKYPTYTALPPVIAEHQGDLRALDGTQVTVHAKATHDIRSAHVDFERDGRRDLPMRAKDREAEASFTLRLKRGTQTPEHQRYQLLFTNSEGADNPRPTEHKIEVIRDLPPEIAITEPKVVELQFNDGKNDQPASSNEPAPATTLDENGSLTMRVEASDPDFQLASVQLFAERNGKQLAREELLAAARGGQFRGSYLFDAKKYMLKAGDRVTYWAVATDNKSPDPNRTETDKRTLTITSRKQADQDQLADAKQQQRQPQQDPKNNQQQRDNASQQPPQERRATPPKRDERQPQGQPPRAGEQPQQPPEQPEADNAQGQQPPPSGQREQKQERRIDPDSDPGDAIERINEHFDHKEPKPPEPRKGERQQGSEKQDSQQQDGQGSQEQREPMGEQSQGGEKQEGSQGGKGQQGKSQERGGSKGSEQQQSGGQQQSEKSEGDGQSQSGNQQSGGQQQGKEQSGREQQGQPGRQGKQGSESQQGGDGEQGQGQKGQHQGGEGRQTEKLEQGQRQPGDQKPGAQQQQGGEGQQGSKEQQGREEQPGGNGQKSGEQQQADPNARGKQQSGDGKSGEGQSGQESGGSREQQQSGNQAGNGQSQQGQKREGQKSEGQQRDDSNDSGSGEQQQGAKQQGSKSGKSGQQKKGEEQQPGEQGDSTQGESTQDQQQQSGGKESQQAGQKESKGEGQPSGDKQHGATPEKTAGKKKDDASEENGNAGDGGQSNDSVGQEGGKKDESKPGERTSEGENANTSQSSPGKGQASGDKKATPAAQESNTPRKKQPSGGDQSSEGSKDGTDASSPARDKKDSDSQGDASGDMKGGGQEGGGQRSGKSGTGSAGKNTAAEEGGGRSNEKGEGETSSRGGEQARGKKESGQSKSSGDAGEGSQSRPGGQQRGKGEKVGKKEGDDDSSGGERNPTDEQRGGQGQKPSEPQQSRDGKQPQGEKSSNQQSGQNSQGQSDQQPDDSTKSGADPSTGQQQPGGGAKNPKAEPGPSKPGEHTNAISGRGNPTAGGPSNQNIEPSAPEQGHEPGGDEANLDYARKATDLAIQRLKDQMAKGEPDKELLDRLKWSKDDVKHFVERWEKMKQAAGQSGEQGDRARLELDKTLSNLGLRPKGTTLGAGRDDRTRDMRQTRRTAPPPEYADQYRAYTKGTSQGKE